MNNQELSYKLKYILNELGISKQEFLKRCQRFSPSISKPTVLNAINGKNTILPTIETLSVFIKVCQTSGNEKLKNISYDFLLNDNIKEIEAKNASIYQSIGLSDDVISRLKQYNHPFYYDYKDIINYFFIHIPSNYWKYLKMLRLTTNIEFVIKQLKETNEPKLIKELLRLFDDDVYLVYLELNFKNVYEIYLSLKNNHSLDLYKLDKLKELMQILKDHFGYLLLEINRKFYEVV